MIKLVSLLLFLSTTAFANSVVNEHGIAPYRSGFTNYVKNPSGFRNNRNITAPNATITRDTDAADKIDGIASLICDASAQNGYCEWTMNTIQEGDKTGNCEASGVFKGDASLYKVQVTDTTNVLTSSSVLSNASDWTAFSVNFPCGSSRSIRLTQTESGTGAAVNIGRVYWGRATNIGSAAQPELVGTLKYASTANCIWQSTATTMTAIAADTDCPTPTVTGKITAPSTKIPGFTISAPGNYLVLVGGAYWLNSSTSNGSFSVKLSDGTISSTTQVYPVISTSSNSERTSATGSYTFTKTTSTSTEMRFYVDMANTTLSLYGDLTTLEESGLTFKVYRFPTSEEVVYRPEMNSAYYSGYHDSTCLWTRTNTAYGDFTADASCALVTRSSSGISAAASGSVLPALALTLPRTGAPAASG